METGSYDAENEEHAGFLSVGEGDVTVRLLFPRDATKPPDVFLSEGAVRMLPLDVQERYKTEEPAADPAEEPKRGEKSR